MTVSYVRASIQAWQRTTGTLLSAKSDYIWGGQFYVVSNPASFYHFLNIQHGGSSEDIGSSSNGVNFDLWAGGADHFGSAIPIGSWFSLFMVRSGLTVSTYVNNVLDITVGSINNSGLGAVTKNNVASWQGTTEYLNGYMESMIAAQVAWTTTEIQAQGLRRYPVRADALVGWWPVFPGSGERERDYSGNGSNWSLIGTPGDIAVNAPIVWGAPLQLMTGVTSPAGSTSVLIAGLGGVIASLTALGTLSAIISATGGMVANLTGSGLLSVTITGISTIAAALTGVGNLNTTIPGVGSIIASAAGVGNITVTIPGIAALNPSLAGIGQLQINISGAGALNPALTGIGNLNALIAGIGAVIAGLGQAGGNALATAIAGTGGVTATLTAAGNVQAVIAGSGAVNAGLKGAGALRIVIPGVGGVVAFLSQSGATLLPSSRVAYYFFMPTRVAIAPVRYNQIDAPSVSRVCAAGRRFNTVTVSPEQARYVKQPYAGPGNTP